MHHLHPDESWPKSRYMEFHKIQPWHGLAWFPPCDMASPLYFQPLQINKYIHLSHPCYQMDNFITNEWVRSTTGLNDIWDIIQQWRLGFSVKWHNYIWMSQLQHFLEMSCGCAVRDSIPPDHAGRCIGSTMHPMASSSMCIYSTCSYWCIHPSSKQDRI